MHTLPRSYSRSSILELYYFLRITQSAFSCTFSPLLSLTLKGQHVLGLLHAGTFCLSGWLATSNQSVYAASAFPCHQLSELFIKFLRNKANLVIFSNRLRFFMPFKLKFTHDSELRVWRQMSRIAPTQSH